MRSTIGRSFPEFVEGKVSLEVEGVCHPLIPASQAVRNDVRLGSAPQVLMVSGSNMSGKSTLLRTLGINVVLAQAGAPVRARRLRLTPLAVGASIKLSDSLQGGVSRFYAEILRIRQILDATAGTLPVLFLIDEFLAGTNSHDRRIGAEALVRGLVNRGAVGLVTTHDLALADIAGSLGERAANVHFEDHIEDGKIRFDYVMRPGVVRKSNALELMRSVGWRFDGRGSSRAGAGVRVRVGGCGAAVPAPETARYREWVASGYAGEMRYLTDRRAAVREDPRNLLESARSIICVGKLYQTPWPHSTRFNDEERGWISRYAWGDDYHDVLRRGLERLAARMGWSSTRSASTRPRCWSGRTRASRDWAGSAGIRV